MVSSGIKDKWFTVYQPNPRAAVRLFCFPYAGGNATIYRKWGATLPPFVEVCAANLPGRVPRLSEPPYTNLTELAGVLAGNIAPHLDKPFAMFGHSMGAVICLELIRTLRRELGREPAHLFVSGRRAPQTAEGERRTYDLPEPEFVEELRRLNGTPQEVLEHPELMQLLMPTLRADFALYQTYQYQPEPPLSCPITAFGGLEDSNDPRDVLERWGELTTSTFTLRMFPGDHFFIHTAERELLRVVGQQLQQSLAGPS